jgi:predicted amidophosphoribosyltransferase
MKTALVRTCKRCGKKVGKYKVYCDECKKTREKESHCRYLLKPETKERKRIYEKIYMNRPENKGKRREYYEKYKNMKRPIRHCKRCGKEVGKYRQYCDGCRKTRKKIIDNPKAH